MTGQLQMKTLLGILALAVVFITTYTIWRLRTGSAFTRDTLERMLEAIPRTSKITIERVLNQERVGHAFTSQSPTHARNIARELAEHIREHAIAIEDGARSFGILGTRMVFVGDNGVERTFELLVGHDEPTLNYRGPGDPAIIKLRYSGLRELYHTLEGLLREDERAKSGQDGSEPRDGFADEERG